MNSNCDSIKLKEIFTPIKRAESPISGIQYRQIGVKLWGIGAYERESIDGGFTKYPKLFKVKSNDIIVNKIWARNGSIAVVPEYLDGCYCSNEFPTFIPILEKINPSWLKWLFKTKEFWKKCDEKSQGTSGKNRIKPERFLEIEIKIPSIEEQNKIIQKLDFIDTHKELLDKHLLEQNNNLTELRRAVLQDAFLGKLVPQNPKDHPISEILKKIKDEKNYKKKTSINQFFSSIDVEEIPYNLPKGWVWTKMGDLCIKIHYGFTASANFDVLGTKMLRITDIQNNTVNWANVPFCNIDEKEIEKYILQKNDILIARTGGTIGKSFIVGDLNIKAIFASYLIRLIPSKFIDSYFLKLYLDSDLYWQQLSQKSMGTGQPNVNGMSLSNLMVPLPPVSEQERIVDRVDHFMILCKKLENMNKKRQENLDLMMEVILENDLKPSRACASMIKC